MSLKDPDARCKKDKGYKYTGLHIAHMVTGAAQVQVQQDAINRQVSINIYRIHTAQDS